MVVNLFVAVGIQFVGLMLLAWQLDNTNERVRQLETKQPTTPPSVEGL